VGRSTGAGGLCGNDRDRAVTRAMM